MSVEQVDAALHEDTCTTKRTHSILKAVRRHMAAEELPCLDLTHGHPECPTTAWKAHFVLLNSKPVTKDVTDPGASAFTIACTSGTEPNWQHINRKSGASER